MHLDKAGGRATGVKCHTAPRGIPEMMSAVLNRLARCQSTPGYGRDIIPPYSLLKAAEQRHSSARMHS